MLRAGNFGSAAVAIPRSHPGGGAPPRPLARPFGSYWVVLRLGRGAGLGVSLGRRSRAGSKREPNLRWASIIDLQASPAGDLSFGIRSFRLRAHLAERICRWPSSAEVGIYVDDRHDCTEGQCYGILNFGISSVHSPHLPVCKMGKKGFSKNNEVNSGGTARWSKRQRSDAGAPVPTPRSPRARRFRRIRSL